MIFTASMSAVLYNFFVATINRVQQEMQDKKLDSRSVIDGLIREIDDAVQKNDSVIARSAIDLLRDFLWQFHDRNFSDPTEFRDAALATSELLAAYLKKL